MKIDVVGHTQATYGMPYGVKRLFQDLFFTHVDHVVSEKIFLDRSEGDGSIYFFDEQISHTPCKDALSSAFTIQEQALDRFDREFLDRLRQLREEIDEIRAPLTAFERQYEDRSGAPFSARRTRARISFVYGFVDEGLWGLPRQSHYGLEGDLMTVLARIEKSSLNNEILATQEFIDALKAEDSTIESHFRFDSRIVQLKGIGNLKIVSISRANSASSNAA